MDSSCSGIITNRVGHAVVRRLRNSNSILESVKLPYLIGTDEAGYGPNLGPLTIAGTLWETESIETDLYQALSDTVASRSTRSLATPKLFIADSKKVYSGSIRQLETNVLAIVYAFKTKNPCRLARISRTTLPTTPPNSQRTTTLAGRTNKTPPTDG